MRAKIPILLLLSIFLSSCFLGRKSAVKIYRNVNNAVVRIFVSDPSAPPNEVASGVIIKSKRWILTNYHITAGKKVQLIAEHNGKSIKLDSVWAVDAKKDIMILAFSSPDSMTNYKWIPNIKIGNSDKLKVGEKVYAIGSPFGYENTMTDGMVSGLRSSMDTSRKFIQISAPISPGSSGGAILNAKGELIGLSELVMNSVGNMQPQNINFAIPINEVMKTGESRKKNYEYTPQEYLNYYYQAGNTEFYLKRYDSAIAAYKDAIPYSEDSTETAMFLSYIGVSYTQLKDYDSAISNFNRSLSFKKISDTYIALGNIYFKKQNNELAIQNYKDALALYPGSYVAIIGLTKAYIAEKNYDYALRYLEKATLMQPENPQTSYYAGLIALSQHLYNNAITCFHIALRIKPDYANACLGLAQAYQMKGDTVKANEYRIKAQLLNNLH